MNWIGLIAVYIVAWAVCLFLVLPWGVHNQSDTDEAVAGTERGAPVVFRIWKKLLINTVLAAVVVALIFWGASNPVLQRYWH
jgi:predicted secreted protein